MPWPGVLDDAPPSDGRCWPMTTRLPLKVAALLATGRRCCCGVPDDAVALLFSGGCCGANRTSPSRCWLFMVTMELCCCWRMCAFAAAAMASTFGLGTDWPRR